MRCFTIPVADSAVLGSSDGHAGVVRVGGAACHSLVRQARTEDGQWEVETGETYQARVTPEWGSMMTPLSLVMVVA